MVITANFDREPIDRWAHIYTLHHISRYDIGDWHEVRMSTMIADKISLAEESIGPRGGISRANTQLHQSVTGR